MVVDITRCDHLEKNDRKFCILHYVSSEDGRVGKCFASEKYADKLMNAAPGSVHRGYDRVRKSEFLYVRKEA